MTKEIKELITASLIAVAIAMMLLAFALTISSCTNPITSKKIEIDGKQRTVKTTSNKLFGVTIFAKEKLILNADEQIEALKLELKKQAMINEQQRKDDAKNLLLNEQKRGSWFKFYGFIVAGIGALLHFAVKDDRVKSLSTSVMAGGVVMIIIGLGMIKAAKYDTYVSIALGFAVVGLILYKCRDFSVIEKVKDRLKKKVKK